MRNGLPRVVFFEAIFMEAGNGFRSRVFKAMFMEAGHA